MSVGLRVRRNCSDRYDNDQVFVDKLREYKGYLLNCHYQEEQVNRAFFKAFKIKRHLALVGKKKTDHNSKPKINFVTDFDPMFPDINKILNKHKHILLEDEQCKKLFTENCFRVTHRRGHKNLKEWLAPSNVISREINPVSHDELNPGCKKCGKCGKNPQGRKRECGIYNCHVIQEANKFKSNVTGESYKIRQKLDCDSENVIYLVECKKCRKQGVGSTEDFISRISNYISHILTKRPTCKMVQHFYLTEGHSIEDFTVTGIVGLVNPPKNSEKKSERLGNFEGYWQVKLMTLELYGLNDRDEFFNTRSGAKG